MYCGGMKTHREKQGFPFVISGCCITNDKVMYHPTFSFFPVTSIESQITCDFVLTEETYGIATSIYGVCKRARKPHTHFSCFQRRLKTRFAQQCMATQR
mmetsp:Transcript_13613/g.13801  ORF Transcript_13613/g.13801 Transcript_13613/m.13801 type:complete len:99 (+) Transcript_13613:180-476(+)